MPLNLESERGEEETEKVQAIEQQTGEVDSGAALEQGADKEAMVDAESGRESEAGQAKQAEVTTEMLAD